MKTAQMPSLRVAPELRQSAEALLEEGETLSRFVEQAIRAQIDFRQQQRAFIARGLASRDEARRTKTYFAADDVVRELDALLQQAKAKKKSGA